MGLLHQEDKAEVLQRLDEEQIMEINLVAYKDVDASGFKFIVTVIKDIVTNPIVMVILIVLLIALGIFLFNMHRKKQRVKRRKARLSAEQKGELPRDKDYSKPFEFKDDNKF